MKKAFASAIRGPDGEVDAGYLALAWCMVVTINCIPAIIGTGIYVSIKDPSQTGAALQAAGIAATALAGGFATIVGAVGLFRAGDKDRQVSPAP